MTPDRWAQIRQIFDGSLERAPKDRAAYLRVVCARDDELRREVESLLASHESSNDFLARPAADLGHTQIYAGEESGEYPAGFRAGPYQLQRRIGRGGMGSVWLAERVDPGDGRLDGRPVAVKLVKRGMDTQEILRRFRMERQVLASLDHPNIARLIDGGSTPEGLPYLSMEYVEGVPIDQYCENRKCPITDRLRLFRDVCAAVQFAHQNLVVHRDIKTANILVTAEGVPKLLDFGIAKLLRTDLSTLDMAQTRPELRPMTLDYASPEQVRGEPITTSTDVYSLGVLLYKLLTGKMPYGLTTRSPDAVRHAICEVEPKRPSSVILTDAKSAIPQATQKLEAVIEETRDKARKRLKQKLAGDLDMILLKALRKEPPKRYASVEQFSEDVRRYLEGRPVIARIDTPGYRLKKFLQRNVAGVIAAAVIVTVLAASAIVSVSRARRAALRFDETNTALQSELVRAYLRIGDDESARKAYEMASAIVLSHPDRLTTKHDLARAAIQLGLYGDALTQLEALSRADPQDLEVQKELWGATEKIGNSEFEKGNLLGALSNYSRALRIAEGLAALEAAAGQPVSRETRRALAASSLHEGEVLLRNGARDAGMAKLRKALAIYRELHETNRESAEALQWVTEAEQMLDRARGER